MTKKIINVNDIEKLANDKTIKTDAILQKMVSKIVSLDLPNTDQALDNNGIIDRESVTSWLKAKMMYNLKNNYWGYLITESQEINELSDSGAQWWLLDAYERVNPLSVPDVEALADELGLLGKN